MDIYTFLEKNSYYVVLIISLIVWLGIFLYMMNVSRKVSELEKKENKN
jgi:CcmD family protein